MKEAPEIDALTPEYVEQVGQEFIDALLKAAPADMVLRHYSPEQRLAGLDPEDIRRYLERLEQQGRKH